MPLFGFTEKFSPHVETKKIKRSAKLVKKLNIQIKMMLGYMASTKNVILILV